MDLNSEHLASATFLQYRHLKSFRDIWLCGPGHISTTGVALHVTPNQAHVLEKLYGDGLAAEEVCEEFLVWSIFPQH
jgi:hypothetical protein